MEKATTNYGKSNNIIQIQSPQEIEAHPISEDRREEKQPGLLMQNLKPSMLKKLKLNPVILLQL